MPWVTVSEAARLADRSAQWVRDQIRTERLPAQEWPAGSRIRLLVDQDDVVRLVAEGSPRPYRRPRPDGPGDEPGAGMPAGLVPADTSARQAPDEEPSRHGNEITMDSFVLETALDEKVKLGAQVVDLQVRVAELEGEVRTLRAKQVHLLATLEIAFEAAREARS